MQKNLTVRLQDILNIDLLVGAEVLAGSAGMSNEITSVNVMEVPDIVDWVRPGEFLLTTAYSLANDVEAFNTLLPMLAERGVCGMGIKVKRYIEELPQSVIDTADRLPFPIIKIPTDVSYGDLMKRIFTYIIGEQTRLLEKINTFNNQVKDVMLRHGGHEKIAELIYSLVNAPIMIVDEVFKSRVFFCGDDVLQEQLDQRILMEAVNGDQSVDQVWQEMRTDNDLINDQIVNRFSIPIYFDDDLYGRIIIWDINSNIGDSDLFVIESAASLIALHTVTRVTISERENVHRNNFLELLMSNSPESQAKAISDAEYFDFNPEAYHQCLVLRINHGDAVHPSMLSSRRTTESRLVLLGIISQAQRQSRPKFISATKPDEAFFLLEFERNSTEEARASHARDFCDSLLKMARNEKMEFSTYIGVGQCYLGYKNLGEGLHEAQQVVRILQSARQKQQRHCAFYNELGITRLFGIPELRDDMLNYANEILKPLIVYDEKHDGELLETVRVYFDYGANLRKISEVLFTHYNTIIYRINRIRDVYGIDLKDPETAFTLQLAIRIRDMLL